MGADLHGSRYTNSSCTSIPNSKNCFRHGRSDRYFLNWRWKPDKCVLPRFDPKTFLEFVKGKKLGFIGDSVARNHVESLLCSSQRTCPLSESAINMSGLEWVLRSLQMEEIEKARKKGGKLGKGLGF
ncbi:hypothetical protein F3Y22_tig00113726pilonHSYRG00079 [Hibiscus syriacus]|uniref:Uncharacterized protein n=1 Tax=Hibiscus syriacus TaxID=106335 RepID=A0A6A2XGQ1_HIBSY|nr:hypothetical protein F3Y22_tig00113726pilonHSYRG00079 [Hibiscus syriacus]